MDAERLVESIIRGALRGKRKRSTNALRYLTGGKGSLLNTSTLLAAAGVAWGLYETMTQSAAGSSAPSAPSQPLPATSSAGPTVPPPLPGVGATPSQPADVPPGLPPELARTIRLTISAARADGTLTPVEETAILDQARAVGAEEFVRAELARPTSLATVLAGARPEMREDLYRLAFAIVRADEAVSGAERIYLAQVAHQLGLTPEVTARLEDQAASRIDAAGGTTP